MKKICLYLVFIISFFIINVFAKVSMWKFTSNTWARSEHGDEPWADKYYGTVSINGNEPFWSEGKRKFATMIKLTYDVQGTITVLEAYADGINTVVKDVVVEDKWNFSNKKSTVKCKVETITLPGNAFPFSINNKLDK
ncbi:MAG: hypothetical protein MR601_06210 [Erysipelotrichaceae bacterium]|nr:hypothetical protein [Erysipelotrichaceae bacterium]